MLRVHYVSSLICVHLRKLIFLYVELGALNWVALLNSNIFLIRSAELNV